MNKKNKSLIFLLLLIFSIGQLPAPGNFNFKQASQHTIDNSFVNTNFYASSFRLTDSNKLEVNNFLKIDSLNDFFVFSKRNPLNQISADYQQNIRITTYLSVEFATGT